MPVPPVQACAGTSWAAHLPGAEGLLVGAGTELIQSLSPEEGVGLEKH